jgi:hypothetical protein
MLQSLLILLIVIAVPTTLFSIRFIRMLDFHKQWTSAPGAEERKAARTNFIIHLIVCVILFWVIVGLVFWISNFFEAKSNIRPPI